MIHQEEVASVLAVLDVLEYEAARLGACSRLAEIWKDWTQILKGEPAPFQHPWEMPATTRPVSVPAASDG